MLPVPNLDDRDFQSFVDEAKRYVQRHCPEWTDHNVSDPGVTLIETFAFMTEQLAYRLNRVPDRLYVKFLELLGVRMFPPTPARVPVTFWLSTPAQAAMAIRTGAMVSTVRTDTEQPIIFSTQHDLIMVPTALRAMRRQLAGDASTDDMRPALLRGEDVTVFDDPPRLDDCLLVGLDKAAPRCALRIDINAEAHGIGVNPAHPPLQWEAWTGEDWTECEVVLDQTGGLNRPGRTVLLVPPEHEASLIDGQLAGWLRVRVVEPLPGQPGYSASPTVRGMFAGTVGGTIDCVNAEIVEDEALGESEGVPSQRFQLARRPVLAGTDRAVLETTSGRGWLEWLAVENFAASDPADRHYVLDAVSGEVEFGPSIRLADGSMRQYGAVPPAGTKIRMRRYSCGGGARGNVKPRTLSVLKSSIPFVAGVQNLHPAHGGVDGESLEDAKRRGPILLRTRSRAVTAEDYETISREAAPEIARIQCLTAGEDDVAHGAVKIMVVPAATSAHGQFHFPDLVPSQDTLDRISARLDEVRLVGTKVLVEPPRYRGITVVARLVARTRLRTEDVRRRALVALYAFINPLTGGPDRTGWPFGRPVVRGEIFGLLQSVQGVDVVEDVRVYGANPVTGERGAEFNRLSVGRGGLVFSYDHQVRVEEH
jgi:predicted phage baseplate assembly protein